ncbi:MAG: hypothetical protein B7C55_02655 [Actinomycetales bacterium mxb001]|nr:MAG: hypothetical protein B7C55_02655 [Actinomycetales bacterium mxb001]
MSARTPTAHTRSLVADLFGDDPFRGTTAAEHGISRGQLRAALGRGYLVRLRADVYIAASALTLNTSSPLLRAKEALAVLQGIPAVVAGRVASDLHGLPFLRPHGMPDHGAVTELMVLKRDAARLGRRPRDLLVRPVPAFPKDTQVIEGVRVTSLLHTAIDVIRMGLRADWRRRAYAMPLPEALALLDAATFRSGARTPSEAAAMVKSLRPRFRYGPGIRSVDLARDWIEPLSETPLESWSRGHMIVSGLPLPLVQHVVMGADGISYRVDFCWPEMRLIGEADGLGKYGETPQDFRRAKDRELRRQRALEAAGWTVVRWTWDELVEDPLTVMQRLRQAAIRSHGAA